jgi:Ca2+-transporting ATPase
LGLCHYQRDGGRVVPLTAADRTAWEGTAARWAGEALRVLGFAYRPLGAGEPDAEWDTRLIWIGLVGLMDPPRPEAVAAVATARRAGIRTVMITGDHPRTALAIAARMGILGERAGTDALLTGQELDRLDDDALARRIDHVQVCARVSPKHKLRLVRALRRRGHVVAMTGDGVNDAPAIKEADVGIAMGITGTDVAKEAAAMILADDNFATIVHAVREGRAIYDNIRKFLRYLLACNIGEVLVMLLAALAGLPLPLLPIQILLVNLATDGLPAMALGLDVPAADVMVRPPRPPRESIFARGLGSKIALRGMLIGVTTLGLFLWAGTRPGATLDEARTVALATLVLSQLFHVFDARSEDRNFLAVPLGSNPWILGAVASSMALLAAVVYVPTLRALFHTAPLDAGEWALVLAASGFIQAGAALRYIIGGERQAPSWERVEWARSGS